jgi:hypothetical protein
VALFVGPPLRGRERPIRRPAHAPAGALRAAIKSFRARLTADRAKSQRGSRPPTRTGRPTMMIPAGLCRASGPPPPLAAASRQ